MKHFFQLKKKKCEPETCGVLRLLHDYGFPWVIKVFQN